MEEEESVEQRNEERCFKREHLSETDKGSYYNQSEWLEEYENSGWHYSRAFDETYVNGFISDNISDTSDEEELQSSDKDSQQTFQRQLNVICRLI